jgi:hypothetical protein
MFYDSLTANGNKLKTYRNLKEKYETDTYLFLKLTACLFTPNRAFANLI